MSKTKNAAIEREQNQTRLSSAEREQSRPQGNLVIDDQNKKNEKQQQVNNRRRDINRLTKETNYQMFSALTQAMKEVQGDRKTGEAICDSELYCDGGARSGTSATVRATPASSRRWTAPT